MPGEPAWPVIDILTVVDSHFGRRQLLRATKRETDVMEVESADRWATAAIALAGLLWTAVSQTRNARSKRQAEQAEQAGRLIELLRSVDLGGLTPGLNLARMRALHEEQIQSLQQVVRLGAADFSSRALRGGVSGATVFLLVSYAVLLAMTGISMVADVRSLDESDQSGVLIAGATFIALAAALAVTAVVALYRAQKRRKIRVQAGIRVQSVWQYLREVWITVRAVWHVRRMRIPRSRAEDKG